MKDKDSRAIAAHVVPAKGGDVEWAVAQACRDLVKWGIRGDVVLRSDQEPALKDFVNEMARQRGGSGSGRTIVEHSPVRESQANGFIESGVKTLEGLVRTLKLALERRIKIVIDVQHPVFAWLVEHAADMYTKFYVGDDGCTAYRRLKGKECRGELLEFGCLVYHRVPGKTQGGLLSARWVSGIWLGKRFASEEHIVSMPDGKVVRARAVQAYPQEAMWSQESVMAVVGVPWAPTGTLSYPTFTVPVATATDAGEPIAGEDVQLIPRGMQIKKPHLVKFGYTQSCRKCSNVREGNTVAPTLGHTRACRERIMECVQKDPKMKADADAANERKVRYLSEEVARQDEGKRQKTSGTAVETALEKQDEADVMVDDDPVDGAVGIAADETSGASSSGLGPEDRPPSAEPTPMQEGDAPLPTADTVNMDVVRGEKRGRDGDEEEAVRPAAFRTLAPEDERAGVQPGVAVVMATGTVEGPESKFLICEAFSPPRLALRARERGLRGGWSLDIRHEDPVSRRAWDLSDPKEVQRLKQKIRQDRPRVLVLSPPCTMFSILQNLNLAMDPVEYAKAVKLFETAIELCELQASLGGVYVLEHPLTSRAWKLPKAVALLGRDSTCVVNTHMCAHGMVATDAHGMGLVYKPTKVVTNGRAIAEKINLQCTKGHRHVHLVGGRAAKAAEYPKLLCDRIVDGALIEDARRSGQKIIAGVLKKDGEELCDMCDPQDDVEKMIGYVDSRTGEKLCDTLVRKARDDELRMFNEMKVKRYASQEEFWNDPFAKLIGTTWVDTNKGTKELPDVRSRLCAQEFAKDDPRDDLFAATPPLLGVKLILSLGASCRFRRFTKRLMVLDVKRAFLYGDAVRSIYTKLPPEDPRHGEPGVLWKLLKAMYGTRDAPAIWQKEVRKLMLALGFRGCKSNPCIYIHDERDLTVDVHVDDFLCLGERADLDWLHQSISEKFQVKKAILGPGEDEQKKITFLGRSICWTGRGLEYEADPKHVQVLLEEWDMKACRGVASPGVKESEKEEEKVVLPDSGAKAFRRAAARLNYLAQDRADIAYATKELARSMAAPRQVDVVHLKRTLRYLKNNPRAVIIYAWQNQPQSLSSFVDSDWAGCERTRKSTSGGVLMHGTHCLAHWARTQANVALSSGEAELNAALKGGVELIGAEVLLHELGRPINLQIFGDSAACKGMLSREGAGRLKHIQVKQLWLQEHMNNGHIKMIQVPRAVNSADAFTKHWGPEAEAHFSRIGCNCSV